jgi:hypothetical protein
MNCLAAVNAAFADVNHKTSVIGVLITTSQLLEHLGWGH